MDKLKYYLGTGLKFVSEMDKPYDEYGKQPEWAMEGLVNDPRFGLCVTTKMDQYRADLCKFKMRPLSSLTKPITVEGYNGGEPFVPMDELKEVYQNTPNFDYLIKANILDFHINNGLSNSVIEWCIMVQLIEWHFWIFDQSLFGKSIIEIKE